MPGGEGDGYRAEQEAPMWSHGGQKADWRTSKSAVGIEARHMTGLDVAIMVTGVLVIMASFFPYYVHTLDRSFGSTSRVTDAWDGYWGASAAVASASASAALVAGILIFNAGNKKALRLGVLALNLVSLALLAVAFTDVPHYAFSELGGYSADSTDGVGYAYWATVTLVVLSAGTCLKRLAEVADRRGRHTN